MYRDNTDDLERILENTHPDEIDRFYAENKEELLGPERPFMQYMNTRLREKGLLKQDVFLQADIPLNYGYKLLTEEKVTKQRDVILRICYAAGFTVQETQRALEIYHMERLYARDRRDALLITCLNDRPGIIIDLNELLIRNKLQPLRSSGVQE